MIETDSPDSDQYYLNSRGTGTSYDLIDYSDIADFRRWK